MSLIYGQKWGNPSYKLNIMKWKHNDEFVKLHIIHGSINSIKHVRPFTEFEVKYTSHSQQTTTTADSWQLSSSSIHTLREFEFTLTLLFINLFFFLFFFEKRSSIMTVQINKEMYYNNYYLILFLRVQITQIKLNIYTLITSLMN